MEDQITSSHLAFSYLQGRQHSALFHHKTRWRRTQRGPGAYGTVPSIWGHRRGLMVPLLSVSIFAMLHQPDWLHPKTDQPLKQALSQSSTAGEGHLVVIAMHRNLVHYQHYTSSLSSSGGFSSLLRNYLFFSPSTLTRPHLSLPSPIPLSLHPTSNPFSLPLPSSLAHTHTLTLLLVCP